MGRDSINVNMQPYNGDVGAAFQQLGQLIVSGHARLEAKIDGLDQRLTGVEGRLTGVEGRLTGVEERLTGVEERLTGVEERLTGVEERLTAVEMGQEALAGQVNRLELAFNHHTDVVKAKFEAWAPHVLANELKPQGGKPGPASQPLST